MKPTLKSVFNTQNWIIYNILENRDGTRFRIDARARFPRPNQENRFSSWGTAEYLNRLCLHSYGKKIHQMSVFKWY